MAEGNNTKSKRKSNNSKNNKRKRTLFIILAIVAIIIVFCIIKNSLVKKDKNEPNNVKKVDYVQEIENGIKINRSTHLNESKTVNGITFTNIQLTTKDGMTTLLADVINNSGKETALKTVKIKLKDNDNNELVTVSGIIKALKPGESAQLNIGMTSDFIEAYDIEIEF